MVAKSPARIRDLKNLTKIQTNQKPEYKITLKADATYGDSSGFFLSPSIDGVAVDHKKRVYILNLRAKSINVYNPDGSYLRNIGRNGRGPGEFQMPYAIQIKNNRLYVLGYVLQKICVYNLKTMQYIRDDFISLNRINGVKPTWFKQAFKHRWYYRATNFYVRPDDNYLVFFSDNGVGSPKYLAGRTYVVSIFSPEAGKYIQQNVLSFRWTMGTLANHHEIMFFVPYKRRSEFAFYNGQLVYGWTGGFLFKFYNDDGKYEKALYYPFKKAKLNIQDVFDYYHNPDLQTKEAIRNDTLPETWPVFNKVVVSDKGRLWVSTYEKNRKIHQWWVLDQNGKLLAQFKWPVNRIIEVVKDDYAYALVHDSADGIDKIVRYKIKMEK